MAVQSLFAYGPDLWSHQASGWVSVGTVNGISVHTDGLLATATVTNELTAAFAVDILVAQTPLFIAFFNHNFTGTVRVQGSNVVDFSVLALDLPVTHAPLNCWIDLRPYPATARFWRVLVTGNNELVRLGELVVGTSRIMQPHQWGFEEGRLYVEHDDGTTDFGTWWRRKQRFSIRSRSVRYVGTDAVESLFRVMSDYVGRRPSPVVWIPDDADSADCWFLDWPDTYETTQVIENRHEIKLFFQEQSPVWVQGELVPSGGVFTSGEGGSSSSSWLQPDWIQDGWTQ